MFMLDIRIAERMAESAHNKKHNLKLGRIKNNEVDKSIRLTHIGVKVKKSKVTKQMK